MLNQYRMRYTQFHDDYFDALSTYLGRECTFLCLYKIKKKYSPFYRRVFLHFNQIMEEVFSQPSLSVYKQNLSQSVRQFDQ